MDKKLLALAVAVPFPVPTTEGFILPSHYYLRNTSLLGFHIAADAVMALAYLLIALALLLMVQRRQDVPFRRLLWLFAAVMGAGGVIHGLAIWTVWFPTYWLSGSIKALTAALSLYAAAALISHLPVRPAPLSTPEQSQVDNEGQPQQEQTVLAERDNSLATVQDTTAQLNRTLSVALSLQTSEARFKAVFEQAAVGMARLSATGHWLEVNQTLCDLLGYTADELTGQSFQAITDPADAAQDDYYYQQLIQTNLYACRFEKRYVHKDGTPIWTMVTVSTERTDEDEVLAFIAVIEDIRQLKQARTELQQRASELAEVNNLLAMTTAVLETRNAELDQFAYVASHDLKAPLRAIANLSQWIEEDLETLLPEENRYQLSLLRNRVHRMEGLINGLLEYSRVGRREYSSEEVSVDQLLQDIIDSLAPPEQFTVTWPANMPVLKTHRLALRQVFANLISNGIKHRDRLDGHISITAQDKTNLVEFSVTDDGPGIDPRYHDKIFIIFQTLKARDEFESTGIGLAVVKKIVESEGGTIHLDSALGEGATFRFTWPK